MSSDKIFKKMIIVLILLLGVLTFGAAASVVTWSTPCCPNIYVKPVYDYYGNQITPPQGDPYYLFPAYCSCPFLDDALNRRWYYYFPDIIINSPTSKPSLSSSCSICSGGAQASLSQSITYISENTNFQPHPLQKLGVF